MVRDHRRDRAASRREAEMWRADAPGRFTVG